MKLSPNVEERGCMRSEFVLQAMGKKTPFPSCGRTRRVSRITTAHCNTKYQLNWFDEDTSTTTTTTTTVQYLTWIARSA